jgi:hypothetical protein
VFYISQEKEIESMEQEIERDDIVEFEGEEWRVYWKPTSGGQVELVENKPSGFVRNTVAWLKDVTLLRKAEAVIV